jgi:DUF1016 N-terminal domain
MIEPIDSALEKSFAEVVEMIQSAKQTVMQTVNAQLVELYWQVGAYISHKLEQSEWGDAVVQQLADYLARTQPGLRGFTRRNLFRMLNATARAYHQAINIHKIWNKLK